MDPPRPPQTFVEFSREFPEVAEAWRLTQLAGEAGPLDAKAQRLVKLALAVGAGREGAVTSAVRKAAAAGVTAAEIDQVLALAAGTVGFPATVAAYSAVRRAQKPPAGPDS